MTRRAARGARAALATPAPLVSGNVAWTLRALADGGTLVGEPRGLNPKGPTPWVYKARSKDGRDTWDVKPATITALTHAGVLKGRAMNISGEPMLVFALTDLGLAELAKAEANPTPTTGAR